MSSLTSKLLLLNKMGILVKATSDDASHTPGYLYEEINNLTFDTTGQTTALLDFLVSRLEINSCYVKLKVLKLMIHLVKKGHPDFAAGLRRNATGISKATKHSGAAHTLHDHAPFIAVRKTATELSSILFDTEREAQKIPTVKDQMGFGTSQSKMNIEGFGSTQTHDKNFSEQIKSGILQIANSFSTADDHLNTDSSGMVYRAMSERTNTSYLNKGMYKGSLMKDSDQDDVRYCKRTSVNQASAVNEKKAVNPEIKLTYGGKAGGGWEDDGSSDGKSSCHSNGTIPLSEKLQNVAIDDWNQEGKCVEDITSTNDGRRIPTRQELDQLETRCGTLNCDKVVEMLIQKLSIKETGIQMRALCALERLMNTDLLGQNYSSLVGTLEEIISIEGTSKQTVIKSKKILLHIKHTVKCSEIGTEQPTSSEIKPKEGLLQNENILDGFGTDNEAKISNNSPLPFGTFSKNSELISSVSSLDVKGKDDDAMEAIKSGQLNNSDQDIQLAIKRKLGDTLTPVNIESSVKSPPNEKTNNEMLSQTCNRALSDSNPARLTNCTVGGTKPLHLTNVSLSGSNPAPLINLTLDDTNPIHLNNISLSESNTVKSANITLGGSNPTHLTNTSLSGSNPTHLNNTSLYGSNPSNKFRSPSGTNFKFVKDNKKDKTKVRANFDFVEEVMKSAIKK